MTTPEENLEITIKLPLSSVNLLLKGAKKLPYEEVAEVIKTVFDQAMPQYEEYTKQKEAPDEN